jgi:hypothetical protein
MLNTLIKDFAAYKLKEKYGEKVETKKFELIKKLDEKLGGEGAAQKAKDALKSYLQERDLIILKNDIKTTHLFLNQKAQPISRQKIYTTIQ